MSLTSECLVRQCLHRLPPTCRADCSAHGVHQLGRPSLADPRFHAGAPACTCPPLSAYGTGGLFAGRSPGGSNGQKSLGCPWPRKPTRFKEDAVTGPAGPPGAALRSWRRRLAPCKHCGGAHDPWVRRDRGQGSPPPPGVPACTAKRACRRRPAGAAWGACWPAGRVHAWTGGATAGTGHPQSVGCAHLELHASLRAPRAALAPPTAWRATAAPEAQPPAMALVQIVVRARPAAHDTSCHRLAALHAWQFDRCWACGSLCAGRAMLSPLEGLRTSAARTTSCSAGCVVALAALRPHCALGKWAGAMQQRRECQRLISDPARLACDSVADRAILSPIAAGVVDTPAVG